MVNTPDALAQLKDIHLPPPVGWWPLAPGWYILGFTLLIIVGSICIFTLRHYHHTRAKRQALRVLKQYQEDYSQQTNGQLTAARLSELLKRVALAYYPRARVASLEGQSWVHFLNSTSHDCDFNHVYELLILVPYQPSKPCDLSPLFTLTKEWIKQRRGRCLN